MCLAGKKKKAIESGQAPTQQLRRRSVSALFFKTPAPTEKQINNVFFFFLIIILYFIYFLETFRDKLFIVAT